MNIYGVHSVRPREVRLTEGVYSRLEAACKDAEAFSRDPDVLAAGVTRFTVDDPGNRSGVALYVDGERQAVPYVSNCRRIFSSAPPGAYR